MLPEPETTGRGARAPNLPQGSSGYVTPGGQTLYPGDTGGGGFPWDTTSGLGSLIQQIAGTSSGPGSAFGFSDLGSLGSVISDIVSQLGPPSQDGKGDLTKLLNSMFQMPIMNQYSGNFGSRRDDVAQMIADYAAQLHSIGDPTHGRVPGTSTKQPNIPTPADFAAHARTIGAHLMKQWTDYELQGHDANRGSPIQGGPHPHWWSDDDEPTDVTKDRMNAAKAASTSGAITGAVGGAILGARGGVGGVILGALGGAMVGYFGGFVIGYTVGHAPIHKSGGFADPFGSGGGGPRSNAEFGDPFGSGNGGPHSYTGFADPFGSGGGGPRGYVGFADPFGSGNGGPRGYTAR